MAAWLESGLSFDEALARTPRFLPPQVVAMLKAGRELGDLRKVLPACRHLLGDAVCETQRAVPYLFMVTLGTTPIAFFIYMFVIPKFRELSYALGGGSPLTEFVFRHGKQLVEAQACLVAGLLALGFIYAGGPRVARWLPPLQWLRFWEPWRRKRMQRDFSTMLGILLDSNVPEPEAVLLAAHCAGNQVFCARAKRIAGRLAEGLKFPDAVAAMDETGEFAWRLRNASHGRTNFCGR